jgi:hypothetical protein
VITVTGGNFGNMIDARGDRNKLGDPEGWRPRRRSDRICRRSAGGRIAIDLRPKDQMASGRSACQLRRFPDRSAAENFARGNFGGAGAACSCR